MPFIRIRLHWNHFYPTYVKDKINATTTLSLPKLLVRALEKYNLRVLACYFQLILRCKNTHYALHASHPHAVHELTLVLIFCASFELKITASIHVVYLLLNP